MRTNATQAVEGQLTTSILCVSKNFQYSRWLSKHLKKIFGQESFHSSFGCEFKAFHETFLIAVQIGAACVCVIRVDRVLSLQLIDWLFLVVSIGDLL